MDSDRHGRQRSRLQDVSERRRHRRRVQRLNNHPWEKVMQQQFLQYMTIILCFTTMIMCVFTLKLLSRERNRFRHVPGTWITSNGDRIVIGDMTDKELVDTLSAFGEFHPRVFEIRNEWLRRRHEVPSKLPGFKELPPNALSDPVAFQEWTDALFANGKRFWLRSVAN